MVLTWRWSVSVYVVFTSAATSSPLIMITDWSLWASQPLTLKNKQTGQSNQCPSHSPSVTPTSVKKQDSARSLEVQSLIDVVTATSSDLQALLAAGKVRSTEIVNLYLDHIERHNHQGLNLNAMICTAPLDLLRERAQLLDEERAAGITRGPLHGIPITIKA